MTYTQHNKLDDSKDFIVTCKKADLTSIQKFLPIEKPDFDGSFANYQLLYGSKGNRIYILGLGEEKQAAQLENAFRKLAFETQKHWGKHIQVYAEGFSTEAIKKAVIGLEMAQYAIGEFKSEKEPQRKTALTFVSSEDIKTSLAEGKFTGETINSIKHLVDAPPNIKTPEFLAEWAEKSAKTEHYKCTVLHEKELKDQGFDAVLSVGKGSVNKPVVIINEYQGKPDTAVDIAFVGKGITFDSGGLSIKPSTNLHYMKSDMGGAAVVLGVVELVAKLKLNINIVGIVASAENAVDGNSYRPGDVINSYSGKTIEIIDTDAEGRLVLADGLSYAVKKIKPKYLIDLATLTGSVVRTLGYSAAGMFTKNQEMAQQLSDLGTKVHERVWQLPLYEDFESDLHSDIADIRNLSGKPIAGAINAAKFLEFFTESHENWMHLDIAGVSFGDSPYAKMKSASGYGIQLMVEFVKAKAE
ncbi:leucyl aminopeptidase family protein [Subsaximicrobium wynnwilliamsii]|uniref:Probable cytosol aminopeptidase n=1 Tax=Subsaximicrobium wynnwilliamsii TaxID=291179 RepID=A0A5C6ZJA9_9FLAO|nr:leucyl aminopeptidase family protein [Subsaximicrobium wynnwilliamsii]TXD83326.1 leucyl aminopeptidase family protein [Subsaximicrobium wynnwilliamsii]TXD89137.1 leucyl aminopeptidase family protein [Subsaximicrobium wynnwilliamsii]TXE03350.1 leucyl aminopeptidase family protein [Subsaximicrobium wynnwilliamsii]